MNWNSSLTAADNIFTSTHIEKRFVNIYISFFYGQNSSSSLLFQHRKLRNGALQLPVLRHRVEKQWHVRCWKELVTSSSCIVLAAWRHLRWENPLCKAAVSGDGMDVAKNNTRKPFLAL